MSDEILNRLTLLTANLVEMNSHLEVKADLKLSPQNSSFVCPLNTDDWSDEDDSALVTSTSDLYSWDNKGMANDPQEYYLTSLYPFSGAESNGNNYCINRGNLFEPSFSGFTSDGINVSAVANPEHIVFSEFSGFSSHESNASESVNREHYITQEHSNSSDRDNFHIGDYSRGMIPLTPLLSRNSETNKYFVGITPRKQTRQTRPYTRSRGTCPPIFVFPSE